ncbi:MAG TPA: hypothetical protein VNZ48_16185 [Xanthobacteraceae bacterium]|jgi:hypothetical protein|nr:hypothetical protein [Xanthobacteraceae bacterium]
MDIEFSHSPIAGKTFHFTIRHATGKAKIKAFIDTSQVFDGECPDPPCHEQIFIPGGTRGSLLRIIATLADGNTIEREINITESDAAPGVASAA